jgi:nicotinamidase-related amidase
MSAATAIRAAVAADARGPAWLASRAGDGASPGAGTYRREPSSTKDQDGMPTIDREASALLIVDFQSKLMPAIDDGRAVAGNARRLIDAAELFRVPILVTEQNPCGLGGTVPELRSDTARLFRKMTFDACRMPGFLEALPDRSDVIVSGCEAHVCVLQTVLGLLRAGRRVYAVRDAMGSRRAESKETAIRRMARNGAEIVTTEMVLFEWLETAEDPRLRMVLDLVR